MAIAMSTVSVQYLELLFFLQILYRIYIKHYISGGRRIKTLDLSLTKYTTVGIMLDAYRPEQTRVTTHTQEAHGLKWDIHILVGIAEKW